LKSRIPQ